MAQPRSESDFLDTGKPVITVGNILTDLGSEVLKKVDQYKVPAAIAVASLGLIAASNQTSLFQEVIPLSIPKPDLPYAFLGLTSAAGAFYGWVRQAKTGRVTIEFYTNTKTEDGGRVAVFTNGHAPSSFADNVMNALAGASAGFAAGIGLDGGYLLAKSFINENPVHTIDTASLAIRTLIPFALPHFVRAAIDTNKFTPEEKKMIRGTSKKGIFVSQDKLAAQAAAAGNGKRK